MHLFSPNLNQRKTVIHAVFLTEIKQKTSDPCRFFNRDQTKTKIETKIHAVFVYQNQAKKTETKIHAVFLYRNQAKKSDPCPFFSPRSNKKNLKPRSMPVFFNRDQTKKKSETKIHAVFLTEMTVSYLQKSKILLLTGGYKNHVPPRHPRGELQIRWIYKWPGVVPDERKREWRNMTMLGKNAMKHGHSHLLAVSRVLRPIV